MALTSGLSSNAVKTALDAVFYGEYEYPVAPGVATALDPYVFMQDSADRAAIITEQFEGPGYFEERAEQQNVAEKTPRIGNQITYNVASYAQSVPISKRFFDDDQHSVVTRLVERMGRNAQLSRDKNAFEVLNNGFSTTLTNDGAALFSNSHTTLSGETVDNLETAALSDTSLETLVVSLMEQHTQDGTLGGYVPHCLVVPPALFKEATIIAKSELRSASADNDLNYFSQVYPGMQVKQSPFLGANNGGSDTAWFLMSRKHSLYRWVRQEVVTDIVDYKYQANNNYIYKAEYREIVGPISYEGLVASNGTT